MQEMLEFECQLQTRLLDIMGCETCCYGFVAQQHTSIKSAWYTDRYGKIVAKEDKRLLGRYLKNANCC